MRPNRFFVFFLLGLLLDCLRGWGRRWLGWLTVGLGGLYHLSTGAILTLVSGQTVRGHQSATGRTPNDIKANWWAPRTVCQLLVTHVRMSVIKMLNKGVSVQLLPVAAKVAIDDLVIF
jgi:hypothetical protein